VWATALLREPAGHQGRGGSKPALAAFADVALNREARILVGVFFLEMLGYQLFVVMLPYLTQYVLGQPGTTAYYLFGAILTTLVTLPVWVPWSRRFGKARVWGASLAVKAVVFAGIGLVGPGDTVLIAALTLVFGAATGGGAVLGPSLKADVVDGDEARTGDRKEGTFFAAWGLAIKMAVGFAILLSGLLLSRVEFQPNVAQTSEALRGIRLSVSFFPFACHVLAIALLTRLDLDEGRHGEIRRQARELVAIRQRVTPVSRPLRRLSVLFPLLLAAGCGSLAKVDYVGLATGGRDGWQRPAEVIDALALAPGDRVAEIGGRATGTGSGGSPRRWVRRGWSTPWRSRRTSSGRSRRSCRRSRSRTSWWCWASTPIPSCPTAGSTWP
jgi:MFS family permease